MADSPLRDVVRREAETAGVDPDLALRIVDAENNGPNWKTGARSGKGAMGLMQLMPATAKAYGVKNPYDPLDNIKGGVALLKDLSGKYPGRPDLIAAAYNAGEPAVNRAGGVPDFAETKAYVEKVDPFAKWASAEPAKPKEDPFAKWAVPADQTQKQAEKAPEGGDTIVGMRTDPQARAERINRNLEEQQGITKQTLLSMPAAGQAIGATLRGAGAVTERLGQIAGKVPLLLREGVAHYSGMGIPGYIGAAVGPKAVEIAGRATSAAGRVIPRAGWGSNEAGRLLGATAAKAAPVVEEAAAPAAEATAAAKWSTPWEGVAEQATQKAPEVAGKYMAPNVSLANVQKAMTTMGAKLKTSEVNRAADLVHYEKISPEAAIARVLKDRSVPRAMNIQAQPEANPAAEFQKRFGTPTNPEAAAVMKKKALSQKSLVGAYGGEIVQGPLGAP